MILGNILITSLLATAATVAAPIYSGTAFYYHVGLGNCGWVNSAHESVIGINTPQFQANGGTPAGGGPCGRHVRITNKQTGNTQQAKTVDSCPGCSWGDLDLSESLFSSRNNGNLAAGIFPITWHFV